MRVVTICGQDVELTDEEYVQACNAPHIRTEADIAQERVHKSKQIMDAKIERDYERLCKPWESSKAASAEDFIQANDDAQHQLKNSKKFLFGDFYENLVFEVGKLSVIAAETNSGKSTMVANLASSEIEMGGVVGVVSLEDSLSDFNTNFVPCYLKDSTINILSNEDKEKANQCLVGLKNKLFVHTSSENMDYRACLKTVENLASKCSVILVDYYQKIASGDNVNAFENVKAFNRGLVPIMNANQHCCFIVFAQLKKGDFSNWADRVKLDAQNISDTSRLFVEMVADEGNYRTKFIIHKGKGLNRKVVNRKVTVGFNRDQRRYCALDDANYIANVDRWLEEVNRLEKAEEPKEDLKTFAARIVSGEI